MLCVSLIKAVQSSAWTWPCWALLEHRGSLWGLEGERRIALTLEDCCRRHPTGRCFWWEIFSAIPWWFFQVSFEDGCSQTSLQHWALDLTTSARLWQLAQTLCGHVALRWPLLSPMPWKREVWTRERSNVCHVDWLHNKLWPKLGPASNPASFRGCLFGCKVIVSRSVSSTELHNVLRKGFLLQRQSSRFLLGFIHLQTGCWSVPAPAPKSACIKEQRVSARHWLQFGSCLLWGQWISSYVQHQLTRMCFIFTSVTRPDRRVGSGGAQALQLGCGGSHTVAFPRTFSSLKMLLA